MLACHFYYSTNTSNPTPNTDGILLFYATNTTTLTSYMYKAGVWVYQTDWPGENAEAGVGCYTHPSTSRAQFMVYKQDQAVEFWSKDMSFDAEWWGLCTYSLKLGENETWVGNDGKDFFAQNEDDMVTVREIEQADKCNGTMAVGEPVLVGKKAREGTRLDGAEVVTTNGEKVRWVFYQESQGNVTGYAAKGSGGWEGGGGCALLLSLEGLLRVGLERCLWFDVR
ncbi:hypothetical protein K470DRAFT_100461 [Piedraia hortae CBS 480.64]|uniref:Fucose-specific lectin n=1 Tax=Piedraia hortae CBS 480.64 TaxID=1314780 RepID=A0A6A7BX71_9PEZI|nr:hypothetical protein K470DRAFT_100461 [Piedraia hortae CBS 480.64]